MRRLRILLGLPLLALPLSVGTVHAATLGDVGHVECTVTGGLSTQLGQVPETVTFTATLTMSCTGVGADENGGWFMTMSGQMSPGFCAGAKGLATASGGGPDGSYNAQLQLTFTGTSLNIAGTLGTGDAGGDAFQASLSATPTSGVPCVNPVTQENLTGQASITDQAPPPDLVFCTASGFENYNPPELLAVQTVEITGDANLNCTNPVSDDRGSWAINYDGFATADCGLAEGTLGMTFGAPDTSGGGDVDYERVGTMLLLSGASTDDNFEILANLTFSGNCATTPFLGASYTGVAAVVE